VAATLGDGTMLARAAIGASRPYVQPPGVVDEELIDLLEQALAMISTDRSVLQVRVISRLCGALYFSPDRERMKNLSAEATEIAREIGTPEALALSAASRRRAYWDREHLSQRLSDSTEMLRQARAAGDVELALQGHAWLIVDLLEQGDRSAVAAQIQAFSDGAERLRQPLYLWNAAVWRAMQALLAGRLELAEQLASGAVAAGSHPESVHRPSVLRRAAAGDPPRAGPDRRARTPGEDAGGREPAPAGVAGRADHAAVGHGPPRRGAHGVREALAGQLRGYSARRRLDDHDGAPG